MNPFQYAKALNILRTKTAGLVGNAAGTASRTVGHLWNAANAGAQATAGHLGSVGAPSALTGLITAAPTLAAGYGVYKGGKGVKNKMDEWKYQRQLKAQGYDQ
jgi:hypothetical protein